MKTDEGVAELPTGKHRRQDETKPRSVTTEAVQDLALADGELLPGWRALPFGGTIPSGGTAVKFRTGDWRSLRPVHVQDRCIHCFICWVFCPDMAVVAENGRIVGFDYEYCKGCGICAKECPAKARAIEMVAESLIEEGKIDPISATSADIEKLRDEGLELR